LRLSVADCRVPFAH